MKVRAKFRCEGVENFGSDYNEVELTAVTGNAEENPENVQFNKYTPSGTLKMGIDNENLVNYFEPGKEYYLDFTPAE